MASDDYNWSQSCMHTATLTTEEKALRELFVAEYLVDYDPLKAAIRCGFAASFANDYAQKFMGEPFVLNLLKGNQLIEPGNKQQEEDEEKLHKRKILAALMREGHNMFISGSARVAALSRLAAIYGMEAQAKAGDGGTHRGGVMVIPAIADLNTWEAAAVESQTKLVSDARS